MTCDLITSERSGVRVSHPCEPVLPSGKGVKPVLNWANVCSPNILRILRPTMIRFLTELLIRRTWFGQFDELYFVLSWLVMRCKLRPELAADGQQTHDRKCRLKSSQYTLIIPHRIIQLSSVSFCVPETRLHLPQVNK